MRDQRPHAGHQSFMKELGGVSARFEGLGITKIEQIALLGQLIGQLSYEIPDGTYTAADIMECVGKNVVSGNQQRSSDAALVGANGG